jgi:DNA-binding MarR family transcriptional regulator
MGLFLLGRKLMEVAEGSLPRGKAATSVRLVVIDVTYHPNSSISEITERTGFPQSLVSAAVARLRDLGVLESEPDPLDRRRTLVRTVPRVTAFPQRDDVATARAALAKALPAEEQGQLEDAVGALNLLARLLAPEVLGDGDGTSPPAMPARRRRPDRRPAS